MLKYLNHNEKNDTRTIWENIFKEDTKQFLDYYYEHKNKDNKILCKYVDEKIVSMLHLNPYEIFINNKLYKSYYIVAVATMPQHRKKGYMAQLLNKSLNDLYGENIPFVFLRPAKKEIYLPFDFQYIYNHDYLCLKENNFIKKSIQQKDYEMVANFTNDFLKNKYNVFVNRDKNYIEILHNEVKSEQGDIILLFDNDKFIGYYVYWGVLEKITRAVFIDEKYTNIKENKPLVMARIVNLFEFFKNFTLKNENDNQIKLCLNIQDNIIKQNNGIFMLNVFKNESYIEPLTEATTDVLNINIQNLLSLFFGYKNPQTFTHNKNILNCISKINLLNKVFIDEEV